MFGKYIIILSISIFYSCFTLAQENNKSLTVNGYITVMPSVMFDSLSGPYIIDNLIHNRLNFRAYAGKNITLAMELRNRFFSGDMVRSGPTYSEAVGNDQGYADLSWNVLNEESFFLNTTIDRLWADFNYGKFQATIGRQRINWGQTLVWNPNDIFNAYSYFDFDYVERPGSDAVRLQYYPGSSSSIELAVKADYNVDITAAALYRFNRWGYDLQLLAGYSESEDLVAGIGWSGAFGSVSFRGEGSWFQPAGNFSDTTGTGLFTAGFDKAFSNNSLAQLQVMYCNNPADPDSFGSLYFGTISTKELAFSKFSAFGMFSYPVMPLLNLSLSGMWFPDMNGYFAGFSSDWSVGQNADISLFLQHFASNVDNVKSGINLGFLRVKLSF